MTKLFVNQHRVLVFGLVLVVVFSIVCHSKLAQADTGIVSGTGLDEHGDPVAGLIVQVWSNQCWNNFLRDAATDAQGNYLVENLPAQEAR
jgi:hypothetical protein